MNLRRPLPPKTTTLLTAALLTTFAPYPGSQASAAPDTPPAPGTISITAIVRDFADHKHINGHPDFQAFTGPMRFGIVEPDLGPDGKPIMRCRTGIHVAKHFKDAHGRNINPFLKRVAAGEDGSMYATVRLDDLVSENSEGTTGNLIPASEPRYTSMERFDQWFRDVAGVNMSFNVPLVLTETEAGSGRFVFDSAGTSSFSTNPWLEGLPISGFFPINDRGFGNFPGHDRGSTNYHFTTEIITTFTYIEDRGYVFGFSGDDDVWVFIDGRLVIDLGGLHSREEQWVDLDDLTWLEHGEDYTLHVFHAERRAVQSNLRIETTIPLRSYTALGVHDAFD